MSTSLIIRDENGDMTAISGMPSADYALDWAARHKIRALGWNVLGTAYTMGEGAALDELRKLRENIRRGATP
jgi:hypothetical protein